MNHKLIQNIQKSSFVPIFGQRLPSNLSEKLLLDLYDVLLKYGTEIYGPLAVCAPEAQFFIIFNKRAGQMLVGKTYNPKNFFCIRLRNGLTVFWDKDLSTLKAEARIRWLDMKTGLKIGNVRLPNDHFRIDEHLN